MRPPTTALETQMQQEARRRVRAVERLVSELITTGQYTSGELELCIVPLFQPPYVVSYLQRKGDDCRRTRA